MDCVLEDDDRVHDLSAAAFGLFGREESLRVLSDVLDGGGSAVATGDPGLGKSSLLRVADQLAQRRGRRVLFVTPTQFDRGLPFAGLAELISQCPDGADRALPQPQRRGLAVALQRAEPDGPEVDSLAVPLAVRGLLMHLCEFEPVALIIDDLQWLDQASVGSLAFALRRISLGPDRLSVLIGTRPDGAGTDLIRSLAEPRHEFTLAPLEDWAIGQLLRNRLGQRWTPPMSAGVARASGGNPFVALMIANAMQTDAHTWGPSALPGHDPVFPVPPSLAELLRERLQRLPQQAREILLLVSAAGRLSVVQLQGAVEEVELRSALEAAADADVAIVGAESVVMFTHPLLASAIYDAASPAERRRAHRVLAQELDDAVERARHRSRTVTAPDESVALELEHAADISRGRGAPQLAGELWEAAALATPASASTAGSLGRWLSAVDAYIDAGDHVAAGAALVKGSALATVPDQQAQVLVRRIAMADQVSGVLPLAEEALRLAPSASEVRADILGWLGSAHRINGNGDDALRVIRMAVAAAAEVKRSDVQLTALNEQLAIEQHWGRGEPKETLRDIERLVESSPDLPATSMAWTHGFFAPWNDETAEGHVREAIRLAVEAGRYGDLAELYICLVLVLIRGSRVRDAQVALEESDRLGAWASSSLQQDMARVLVKEYAGDLDEARIVAEGAVARSRQSGATYWIAGFLAQVGFIETSARNWPGALTVLRELAGVFARSGMVDLEQLLWAVDYADAALQVGATDDVEAAIAVLRRQGAASRPEATVAAQRCQALLTAARGDVDTALSQLAEVIAQPRAECPFEAARSHLALGQVYRRAGYKGMASEALNAAAATFEALGIQRWAERARDEADRVGLNATSGPLTATEQRVADLVGSGHSNQETAAALFMSVKTVEANLTRIYRKLAVRSRTELANRMHKLDSEARHD
jgi:DNA-binding CsgD family transcriptional regulator